MIIVYLNPKNRATVHGAWLHGAPVHGSIKVKTAHPKSTDPLVLSSCLMNQYLDYSQ
jgi:hypothetical protein